MTERNIIDTGMAPEIYADRIGFVENLGTCCRINYVTLSQGGLIVCLKVIRPIATLANGVVLNMLREMPPVLLSAH